MSSVLDRFRLDGRTAIVTGIGPGIGAHVALAFAELGAKVVVNARTQSSLDALTGANVVGVCADIGLPDVPERLVNTAIERFGSIDIVFHNAAGGTQVTPLPSSLDLPESVWEAAVAVNLMAPMRLARAAVPHMKAAGRGSIVNVLSTAGFTPVKTMPLAAHGATKAGLEMLTRYLAAECGPSVRVNALCPGTIAADAESAAERGESTAWKPLLDRIALGRVGLATEAVSAAISLASDASSYVTGQTIFVDGGRVNTG